MAEAEDDILGWRGAVGIIDALFVKLDLLLGELLGEVFADVLFKSIGGFLSVSEVAVLAEGGFVFSSCDIK